jgi:hypothetical protein
LEEQKRLEKLEQAERKFGHLMPKGQNGIPLFPNNNPNYGFRNDGTPKERGFLGVLKRPDGRISTEISIGVNFDGKEMEIPALVPTLSKDEIDFLLAGNKVSDAIVDKAIKHAIKRLNQGKSPFFQKDEKIAEIAKKYRKPSNIYAPYFH